MTYKTIEIETKRPIRIDERRFMEEFSLKYPQDNISLDFKGEKICAHLNSVDVSELKDTILCLSEKYHLDNADNPFVRVLDRIEEIKSYGLKSGKRLYVDYDKERKVKDRKEKVKDRGVFFYTQGNLFCLKNNELPKDFENKIFCSDSESELKKLPDNCVDLIFTSPPYNFGLEYHASEDGVDWNDYFNKLFRVFEECVRVLKFGGRIVINVQPLFSDYIPIHHIVSNFFMQKKLIWKGEVIWEKNNYNCKYTAWGSWKSPSSPYLKYTWEFLEIFCKGALKKEGNQKDADISEEEFKKWVVGKWSIAPERKMKDYGHPAMFPEELAARVIKLFSFKNDVVIDPFNGVGTTTVVAKYLNRKFIGIDMSEKYCKTAKKRLESCLL